MSYNPNTLTTDPVQRIRLLVGDIYSFPLLEDGTYEYLYLTNNSNELDAGIAACEIIINMLVLNPQTEDVGDVGQGSMSVKSLQSILKKLENRKILDGNKVRKIPAIIKTDRSGWSDLDSLYGRD